MEFVDLVRAGSSRCRFVEEGGKEGKREEEGRGREEGKIVWKALREIGRGSEGVIEHHLSSCDGPQSEVMSAPRDSYAL
jgi:hypothetical protein